ncbi:MAG: Hsp20/alpha crystallin family protein [Opitutaceae bacterium]|nr:Hsp20/alpha crystallin family protein [Opitutaceae bacterium]
MNANSKSVPSIRRAKTNAPASPVANAVALREPVFETQELGDAMRLTVYVPGVAARGVEVEGRGADLTVTARKERFVRANFTALHLEGVQHDYRLRLRLGTGFDFAAMAAEIAAGVLTITVPKRVRAAVAGRLACAA